MGSIPAWPVFYNAVLPASERRRLTVNRKKENGLAAKNKKETRKQNSIQRFTRETVGELRKVSWPSRQEALNLTMIVVITMVFMGVFLSVVSGVSGVALNWLLGIGI
ncbi:MAG: preprotein translocase subunit SecE [Anaerolinea sp. 4484_236]|nr:MAG: preprotein translocase subunit SecE [Anaerolinea sp. 4484_236]